MTLWRGLYGIAGPLDGLDGAAETFAAAQVLLAAGARIIQLRDKQCSGRELVARARALAAMCREAGAKLVVNDRLDVALIAGADGVHVGQDDLPVEAVRSALQAAGRDPGGFIIGLSTHDDREVREAVSMGVSYIGFGPIYGTATKSDALSARGTDALQRAVQAARGVPVVAIGGLTLDRADDVASAGASMAAVIADIHRAPEPVARASAWQRRFGGA